MRRVNLGCDRDVLEGFENYDMYPVSSDVKQIDLNILPLLFKDGSVDYVLLSHVFEHLDVNRYEFMRDIHRILRTGGVVEIRVPSSNICVEHTMFFIPKTYFDNICVDEKNNTIYNYQKGYYNFYFKKLSVERIYRDRFSFLFDVFPFLEKCFPYMCSSELVWKLEKV